MQQHCGICYQRNIKLLQHFRAKWRQLYFAYHLLTGIFAMLLDVLEPELRHAAPFLRQRTALTTFAGQQVRFPDALEARPNQAGVEPEALASRSGRETTRKGSMSPAYWPRPSPGSRAKEAEVVVPSVFLILNSSEGRASKEQSHKRPQLLNLNHADPRRGFARDAPRHCRPGQRLTVAALLSFCK